MILLVNKTKQLLKIVKKPYAKGYEAYLCQP